MSRLAPKMDNVWKFHIPVLHRNAQVNGLDYGWFKMEYAESIDSFRVSLYADHDDANPAAQSSILGAATLPDTVSLAEYGGSGVTATIDIQGIV